MRRGAPLQRRQVIAAFQNADNAPLRVPFRNGQKFPRHPRKGRRLQVDGRDSLLGGGVEPGADQYELGRERVEPRHNLFRERPAILHIAAAGSHRDIQREPGAAPAPGFALIPRTGVLRRRLMQADEEHVVAVLEDGLRAVAVVDIPIHDRHAGKAVPPDQVLRRHRHVIEKAVAHRPVASGVMPRRPDRAERPFDGPTHDRVARRQDTTGRQLRHFVAFRTDMRLAVAQERHPALARQPYDFDVRRLMHPAQHLDRSRPERKRYHPAEQA